MSELNLCDSRKRGVYLVGSRKCTNNESSSPKLKWLQQERKRHNEQKFKRTQTDIETSRQKKNKCPFTRTHVQNMHIVNSTREVNILSFFLDGSKCITFVCLCVNILFTSDLKICLQENRLSVLLAASLVSNGQETDALLLERLLSTTRRRPKTLRFWRSAGNGTASLVSAIWPSTK